MKKLFSLILALSLIFSLLSFPASAEDVSTDSDSADPVLAEMASETEQIDSETPTGEERAGEDVTIENIPEEETGRELSVGETIPEELPEVVETLPELEEETMPLAEDSATTASGTCGTNLKWKLSKDGTMTISGSGAMTGWIFQSDIPWNSYKKYIKSVVIDNGVTSIGMSAFQNCTGLTSISIPNSVTMIEELAFCGCSGLTAITILNGGASIGRAAFYECTGLKTAGPIGSDCDYEFSWTESIPSHAFEGCTGLTSITFPEGVTAIGECAFENCTSLTSITIPNGVTSIGYMAFASCTALTKLTIPASATNFEEHPFSYCTGLKTIGPIGSGCNIEFGWPESIPECVFMGCEDFISVTIPDGIKSIDQMAFWGCTGLTSVTIPASVTSIGSYAFVECTGLTDIYYNGWKSDWEKVNIDSEAFDNLSTITIHYKTPGDLDDNDSISATDIIFLVKAVLVPGSISENLTDFTGDGKTNLADVIRLLRYIMDPTVELCTMT